ncbi:TIGR04283 family arsenosugar biosynthesis glycosyltransferase [Boseongicola aestuarii]|uniref:PGL/p-HBAD biosynthesis glycosyltransferase/MT3031 n=1 Tax=Boseongicola aestuarii TaxID=1470561 RepID=A0A238J5X0_9RHOB|nr:TIGR04283 family arsenosugar biosynthesis glycosyltransferase [Boseongicola aestuarii]SMX25350.1 PGL/p-HBAD biosynthesis glycosyltransferase/MT3031 [Boseongicola aestuarii]
MHAPISVVIPTLNVAALLPGTAEALMAGVTEGVIGELVVSDGGSDDGTLDVARALGAEIVEGPAGRGGQIARGVAAARGRWVLILHADTHLSAHWVEAALRHMREHGETAGYFRLVFRAAGVAPKLVALGANLRSRVFGLPYGDQGLLVARSVLDSVGGVPDVALMEDVALARALKGRLRMMEAEAQTSAARYLAEGWARRVMRNLWTLVRYLLGARPEALVRGYEARR